jgi:ABC-type nitrate/sulfonate/bicarbonate transport system permease component
MMTKYRKLISPLLLLMNWELITRQGWIPAWFLPGLLRSPCWVSHLTGWRVKISIGFCPGITKHRLAVDSY